MINTIDQVSTEIRNHDYENPNMLGSIPVSKTENICVFKNSYEAVNGHSGKNSEPTNSVFSYITETSQIDIRTSGWETEHFLIKQKALSTYVPDNTLFQRTDTHSIPAYTASEDAENFISANHLAHYTELVSKFITDCFGKLYSVIIAKHLDPELGDEYIVFNITIDGNIDEMIDCYDLLCEQVSREIPASIRQLIRLSLNPF
ncbi:hypothetical protein CHISP_3645 [Chitinispirillum alkaliphilum]|nr:hypothetical protein CHISP_3645 [Chitinispirillum alkaliphilum]